jgi:hypothetical protein
MYISPITKVHATFDEAKRFYAESSDLVLFGEKKSLSVGTLAQGKRNLIVGEPGVGKTKLLEKIKEHLDKEGVTTELISLKRADSINRIDAFLGMRANAPRALLLDGLDEVQSSRFPSVLDKIEDISRQDPDLSIYLSTRWLFINRYATSFPSYRFITISPFTREQVREYLLAAHHSEADVDDLLNRVMSFSHQMLVIQVPRYLSYLNDFLKAKGLKAAAQVSRNELFEYFIYSKLDLEEKKLNTDKREITKRVLEKLALTMEIYQSNVISKDELMTFFDDLQSDLKLAALSQISLEVFFDYSLLKNNIDTIEFENTEFQEYLAAKEITRFSDPGRAAFSFAVDPNVQEMYPTWFNALTFLVDMQPDLLEQLVEFSGMRGSEFKVVEEAFLTFLSRIDTRNVSLDMRRRLFEDSIAYHRRVRQWLPGQLASALPAFFDASLEGTLKSGIVEAESEKGANRFVPLCNIVDVVGYLFKREPGILLDRPYWRSQLISYVSDKNENGVLQRRTLFALEQLGDPTVIDELPNLMGSDEPLDGPLDKLIVRAFLSACTELDPNNPKCLDYFVDAVRKGELDGMYGLLAVKKRDLLKKFLDIFNADEKFRDEFLDEASIFDDKDFPLVEHIEGVIDDEIEELCKQALSKSAHYNLAHRVEKSPFIAGLWKVLRAKDSGLVTDIVERIKNSEGGNTSLYGARNFFVEVIEKEDVPAFIDALLAAGERQLAISVMMWIKLSRKESAEEIFEAGRSRLPEEYKALEARQATSASLSSKENKNLLRKFRALLEPEPGKFSPDVFDFYNQNAQQLDPHITGEEKRRLIDLITGKVFQSVDPGELTLTITNEQNGTKTYTTSSAIRIFRAAIIAAKRLEVDIAPFRQRIIDFIPFAHSEDLKTVFELVKNIKSAEMVPVLKVYKERRSDLWRHEPSNFVEAVEQYHVVEAIPVLKEFIKEAAVDKYARKQSLRVLGSLSPDPAFMREVFDKYKDSDSGDENMLAYIANGLLITSHGDTNAIHWRIRQVVKTVAPFVLPQGVHTVSELEGEIHNKSFAKPLMELKRQGHEDDYLELLEEAMQIWAKGKQFYAYAGYLWEIVYSYFDNLKESRSYEPLRLLERKISEMKDQDGANWLATRMVPLRRSYLGYLGKPRNISQAIKKYNEARAHDDKNIRNSSDLFRHLQEGMETDLRRWIEGEGAYELIIGRKVYKSKRQEYEKLIQKTLKTQIENILLRRGFQVDVIRESQLYDEKRADFLVRYGFVGPIVIEVKLTTNTDIQGSKVNRSPSYAAMTQYMQGYASSYGILLVIDNLPAKNLAMIKEVFQRIRGVQVISFACYNELVEKRPQKKRKQKRQAKKV